MTTPAQLVQTVSDATGVPLPTIVDIDRKLAIGGLRTKGGRGLSAARMTALDAARLLTAVLTSAQANVSVAAVERYALTHADKTRSSDGLFRATKLADLAALPARHSFVDALAALIDSATSGSLAKLAREQGDDWSSHIEVFAFTRATYGRIRISGLPDGTTANVEYLPSAGRSRASQKPSLRKSTTAFDSAGDLEQSRRVTERTILSIADLLAEESRND